MHLSIHQIVTFREVMRTSSISQAARSVGRTQPAVSVLISNLENDLGFELFVREQGKLTPTPEAVYFLEECQALIDRLDRAKASVSRIRNNDVGRLTVASFPAASSVLVPKALTAFLDGKDTLEISLMTRASIVIEDLIASQQFNIGLAETADQRATISQADFELECVCMIPYGHPLASKTEISAKDLSGEPMAMLFDEHPITQQLRRSFSSEGLMINRRIELRTFEPGLPFVAKGMCCMVADMVTAFSYLSNFPEKKDFVIRRFSPRTVSSISILTPALKAQSLPAGAFVDCLTEQIHQMRKHVLDHLNDASL